MISPLPGRQGRRGPSCGTLAERAAGHCADHRLARHADQQRHAEPEQPFQAGEQLEVVRERLAETEA